MKLNEITPDIIRALKENTSAIGLLSDEEKAASELIGKSNFEIYEFSGEWTGAGTIMFNPARIYRLRPDYEPPQEPQKERFLFMPIFWSMDDCIIDYHDEDLTDYDFIGWTDNEKFFVFGNPLLEYTLQYQARIQIEAIKNDFSRATFAVFMLKEGANQ